MKQSSETPTPEQRQRALELALAETRIEGHEPSPGFLGDVHQIAQGALSLEQARARALERAIAEDRSASRRDA